MRPRTLRYRAVHALELAANNGVTLAETDVGDVAIRRARVALDAVIRCGASEASKLEAAAMLRDGWRPGLAMCLLASRSRRRKDVAR